MSRSRSRLSIAPELERYLDDLIDDVNRCIDDQEDHRENAIADLELKPDALYSIAAEVAEVLYFDDNMSANKAIEKAARMAVNTAIYVGLEKNRDLNQIPSSLEDDLRYDHDDVQKIIGNGRSGRDRDRGRSGGGRPGRDSRQDMARGESRGREDRERDTRDRESRERRESNSEEARAQRRQETNQPRDRKVEEAQKNVVENTPHIVTGEYVLNNPDVFCAENKNLPLAPVYWLGGQQLVVVNNEIVVERVGENVEWEKHRTDAYLAVRKSVKPTGSLLDDALNRANQARDKFVEDTLKKLKVDANVVEENKETEVAQLLTSSEVAGKFYGLGTPMAKMQTCLSSLGLKFLPSHPVIMKVEQYPMWVMNKQLTEAVEDLLTVTDLNQLVEKMVGVMNNSDPVQWAYFHDKVTHLINVILKVELEAKPYLTSVLTEWNDFARWLEQYDNGSMIIWFKNNFNHFISRYFHVYKHGSDMASTFVDGSDEKFASVSITQNLIYLPTESENFGAASATKLGRVLPSVTPKLHTLLATNIDENADNVLVTSSDEMVSVYRRATFLTSKVVFMGEVNW